jgi:hypothetical protein
VQDARGSASSAPLLFSGRQSKRSGGGQIGQTIELENRCTGNRTVGSNPTLSAKTAHLREKRGYFLTYIRSYIA